MATIPVVKFKRSEALTVAERMIRRLMKGETLSGFTDDQCYLILEATKRVLTPLPAMVEMSAPLVIFGDVHGQFTDLLRFFKIVGVPPEVKLLFLGDYVDRCKMSFEIIMLLFSFKIRYPDCIELLRGNHECSKMNRIYGFYEELRRKRTVKIWKVFQEVFNELPLCALVSKRILTMHGGISPHIDNWETLHKLKKPKTVKECDEGVQLDLMWSDPTRDCCGFQPNKTRAASYVFGDDSIKHFCHKMGIDLIVRAHELTMEGYDLMSDNLLCTIFSAPNYCGTDKNCGSVMKVSANLEVSFHTLRPRINMHTLTDDKLRILEKQAGLDPTVKSPMPMSHLKPFDQAVKSQEVVSVTPNFGGLDHKSPSPVTNKAGQTDTMALNNDTSQKKAEEIVKNEELKPETHILNELTLSKEDPPPLWIGTPTPEQKAALEAVFSEKNKSEKKEKNGTK